MGAPPISTLTLSRTPACLRASMVVFIAGIVVVKSADIATIVASLSLMLAINFSGETLTPKSITSNPPPSSSEATRFLPMSCKSPLTVPIPTRRQKLANQLEGRLHRPGGNEQLGNEILIALEPASHFIHGGHHVFVDQ